MKNKTKTFLIILILSIIVNFSLVNHALSGTNNNSVTSGKDISGNIFFDGKLRTYILHLPPNYNQGSKDVLFPLVIVLHGGGGNAENAIYMTDFSPKADLENFVVAYPNGVTQYKSLDMFTWNAGNCCGYALDSNSNDTGFINALIDKLIAKNNIDPKRVFVTGMSNGGMMSYKLGCELAHKIAAIAPVAGALNVTCNPSSPVAVAAFHGTEDMHVLYNGGEPVKKRDPHERVDNSVRYAMDFWTKNNGCNPVPQTIQQGSDGSVIIDNYSECIDNAEVKLYTIVGGGHAWPGGQKGRTWGDEPTQAISATDEMWEFFKAHPKNNQ